jgi:hypothetical protein
MEVDQNAFTTKVKVHFNGWPAKFDRWYNLTDDLEVRFIALREVLTPEQGEWAVHESSESLEKKQSGANQNSVLGMLTDLQLERMEELLQVNDSGLAGAGCSKKTLRATLVNLGVPDHLARKASKAKDITSVDDAFHYIEELEAKEKSNVRNNIAQGALDQQEQKQQHYQQQGAGSSHGADPGAGKTIAVTINREKRTTGQVVSVNVHCKDKSWPEFLQRIRDKMEIPADVLFLLEHRPSDNTKDGHDPQVIDSYQQLELCFCPHGGSYSSKSRGASTQKRGSCCVLWMIVLNHPVVRDASIQMFVPPANLKPKTTIAALEHEFRFSPSLVAKIRRLGRTGK